jgi:hypothetical protein
MELRGDAREVDLGHELASHSDAGFCCIEMADAHDVDVRDPEPLAGKQAHDQELRSFARARSGRLVACIGAERDHGKYPAQHRSDAEHGWPGAGHGRQTRHAHDGFDPLGWQEPQRDSLVPLLREPHDESRPPHHGATVSEGTRARKGERKTEPRPNGSRGPPLRFERTSSE